MRFLLEINSTKENLSFFHCTVEPNPYYPTTRKFSTELVRVIMVNYGQMIRQFNGLGMLDTTAHYINSYAFSAYHDPKPIYKNQRGFVDVFVTWPSYQVTCEKGTGGRPLPPLYG